MKNTTQIPESDFKLHGKVITKLFDLQGSLVEEKVQYNKVVNVSRNGFAALLNAETAFTGIVNYGAVGTGANAPTDADTTLQTEIGRVAVSSRSRAANVTTLSFEYPPTVGNGTLKEFGAYIDGTATVNSGSLFDRVNIDVNKTSSTTLIIDLVINIL